MARDSITSFGPINESDRFSNDVWAWLEGSGQAALKVDEPVRCEVQIERIGIVGYGMMVAEIGLPPGADVDRQSLQDSGQPYEVRSDRVVFYVWPSAGRAKFSFSFKARHRIDANTSPSILYDYYNPEV